MGSGVKKVVGNLRDGARRDRFVRTNREMRGGGWFAFLNAEDAKVTRRTQRRGDGTTEQIHQRRMCDRHTEGKAEGGMGEEVVRLCPPSTRSAKEVGVLVGWCFGGCFGFGVVALRPPSPVGSKEGTEDGEGGHQARAD